MSTRARAGRLAGMVTPVRAALVMALAFLSFSVAPAPALAAETYPVPADGVFALTGHGFGHGRGMSVWGAQGAALQGVPYDQILAHYYPGTTLSSYADRTIRVRLSLDPGQVRLPAQAGLVVIDSAGATMALPDTYSEWRLVPVGGQLQLQGLSSTGWTTVPLNGSVAFASARFENTSTGIVRVYRADSSSVGYRGAVFGIASGPSVLTLLHTPLEQYLRGVVPRESPASWAPAELRAQAVAARTYAAVAISTHAASQYDICDTTACQVFGGSTAWSVSGVQTPLEYASTDAAVRDTAGQVVQYQGQLALTEYSASNGGWSTDGGRPYLVARADPWDGTAPGDPQHTWTARVAASDIEAKYPQVGRLTQLVVLSRDGNGEWGGRVTSLSLIGTAGSVTISGAAFAAIRPYPSAPDGMRSSWFRPAGDPVPFGSFDYLASAPNESLYAAGWAIDPDTSSPIAVHFYVDGRFAEAVTAGEQRPDVGAAYPGMGSAHGFATTIASSAGPHTVCAYAINVAGGSGNPLLGCRSVTVVPSLPFGSFDYLGRAPGGVYLAGWAIDPDTTSPIAVHAYVDGRFAGAVLADRSRPDVAAVYPAYGSQHGYAFTVPATAGRHTVCTYGINVRSGSENRTLGCRDMTVYAGNPFGSFDVATASASGSVRVAGWALDPDTAASIVVHVYVDGQFVGVAPADRQRDDVAAAYPGYSSAHGFDSVLQGPPGARSICVYAINVGSGNANPLLGCRAPGS